MVGFANSECYNYTVQSDKGYKYEGYYEFKLRGTPHIASGEDTMRARMMFLRLLGVLDRLGWSVYAAVDQNGSSSSNNSSDYSLDTWHCCRVKKGGDDGAGEDLLPAYSAN